jgi:hypothetical protein
MNKGQDMDYSQDYCFLCNSTENVYQYDHYEGGELVYSDICNECMKGNK